VVAAHYKKDALLNCGTGSSDISGDHADFTKDTALSEQGRGAAWHVRIKADSHIACRAHAAPMPPPCHAVPPRV
jgi:hypothetical protein